MAGEFPAVPMILDLKEPGHAHVVVGGLQTHIDFLQEFLGGITVEVKEVPDLEDLQLMTRIGLPGTFIYLLPASKNVALAADTRKRIHIWSARGIKKHTAAVRILVKQAANILEVEEPEKDLMDSVGDRVVDYCGEEAPPQAMIWAATWILSAPGEPVPSAWDNPWVSPWTYAKVESIPQRLHTLYRDLVTYVYARIGDKQGIERMGASPSKVKWLAALNLNEDRVGRALTILSIWRAQPDDGYSTALKIGAAFRS